MTNTPPSGPPEIEALREFSRPFWELEWARPTKLGLALFAAFLAIQFGRALVPIERGRSITGVARTVRAIGVPEFARLAMIEPPLQADLMRIDASGKLHPPPPRPKPTKRWALPHHYFHFWRMMAVFGAGFLACMALGNLGLAWARPTKLGLALFAIFLALQFGQALVLPRRIASTGSAKGTIHYIGVPAFARIDIIKRPLQVDLRRRIDAALARQGLPRLKPVKRWRWQLSDFRFWRMAVVLGGGWLGCMALGNLLSRDDRQRGRTFSSS